MISVVHIAALLLLSSLKQRLKWNCHFRYFTAAAVNKI